MEPDNNQNNTPGAAIGAFIVIAVLIIGAIYFVIKQLNTSATITDQATSTATTTVQNQ